MKKTSLKRKTPLRATRPSVRKKVKKVYPTASRGKRASKRIVGRSRGYVAPDWFTAIKPGSHGNNPTQKRLWRVVSETVRKEEWEKYGGKCVSCESRLDTWQAGHCGHFKAWSVCNGLFKYERANLSFQCPNCNRLSDGPTNARFAKELQRRHGMSILDWIEEENQKHRGEKLEDHVLVGLAALWLGIAHE